MLLGRPCHTLLRSFSLSLLLSPLALAEGPPPAEVSVEVAKPELLSVVLEYAARTAGYREVEVRAQVSGILQERTYLEGSKVKQGQVLFRIDPRLYQAALAQAKGALAQEQARYRQTDRDLKRIRELQKKVLRIIAGKRGLTVRDTGKLAVAKHTNPRALLSSCILLILPLFGQATRS